MNSIAIAFANSVPGLVQFFYSYYISSFEDKISQITT